MENQEENPQKSQKRKKKRSATQMAKKFARRRDHSGELESETYQYMAHVLEMIGKEFTTMEDKQLFIENVSQQMIGKEVNIAKNQVGSRVLEHLIQHGDYKMLEKLDEAFNDFLRPFCSDPFASHVLQKMISVCAQRGNQNKSDAGNKDKESKDAQIKKSEIEKYNNIALKLCKYVINNIEEFVWDTYANHVLRTAVECLGGLINVSKTNKKGPIMEERRKVTDEYTSLLITTCKRLAKFPQLAEFNHDDLTSGFVQSLLYSVKDIDSDLNSSIIKRINTECFTRNTENSLSNIFSKECSMRLLEACLAVSNPKDYTDIYNQYFENHIGELSVMKGANFCVQRLFEHCHEKELMEKMFDEISEHLEAVLEKCHTGIFASLAKACQRLHAKQGPFVTAMFKLLHCDEPSERQIQIVPLVAMLKTYEKWENFKMKSEPDKKLPINIHGSLVVQAMLSFNKPIKMVNSMLELSADQLFTLFDDPRGSRILDAFMESQFVGEKSREKFARNLRGIWVKLACSKHGSWCFEKVWAWAKPKQRNIMMEELAEVGESLRSTDAGRLLSAKLNVPLFARSKKDWEESQGKDEKTKALFADIIGSQVKQES